MTIRLAIVIVIGAVAAFWASLAQAAALDAPPGRPVEQRCGPDLPCTPTPSGLATVTPTLMATVAATAISSATPLPQSFVYRLYLANLHR